MLSLILIVTLLGPRRRIDASAVDGSSSRVRAQYMHESKVAVMNVSKQSVSAKK
jgi:hypothetical protein